MRKLIAFAMLLSLSSWAAEGTPNKRIALTPNSTVESSVIAQGLDKKCSGLVLTLDESKADYLLEARDAYTPKGVRNGYALSLFGPNGDMLYHTKTVRSDNAVKDVCKYLGMSKS